MNIDLTGVAVAFVGGVFSIVGTVFLAWLKSHLKDKQAAAVIGDAVQNALGAMQQAATAGVERIKPAVQLPGVPEDMAVGVQYVLDNAGPELARYADITPARIADKIGAQIGLTKIAATVHGPVVLTPEMKAP